MTYTLINLAFFVVPAIAAAIWLRGRWWGVALRSLAILIPLTALFDNLIIGTGIVKYHDSAILGIRIFLAPIEDFGYTVAVVFLVTTLWSKLAGGEK